MKITAEHSDSTYNDLEEKTDTSKKDDAKRMKITAEHSDSTYNDLEEDYELTIESVIENHYSSILTNEDEESDSNDSFGEIPVKKCKIDGCSNKSETTLSKSDEVSMCEYLVEYLFNTKTFSSIDIE
uniref:Uncharacterized protein n=2 Tax=Acrobeloides nanus TaxID=290746 RepID=A0A914EJQ4_9BILA